MKKLIKKNKNNYIALKVYDREGCTTDWLCGLKIFCI